MKKYVLLDHKTGEIIDSSNDLGDIIFLAEEISLVMPDAQLFYLRRESDGRYSYEVFDEEE